MTVPARTSDAQHSSLDVVGATASFVCAMHCAAVTLLLGVAPALEIVAQPWLEWLFLSASMFIGLLALVPGYRQHRRPLPLTLFTGGIAILLITRLLHVPPSMFEVSLVLVAASALITAHWQNRRELRSCRHASDSRSR